ncbi:MAG: SMC-Scp complex subunit ScpB [Limnochordia bacterium]|jgi:segregation and condensation protein B
MTLHEAERTIEALIFAADEPLSAGRLAEILGMDPKSIPALVERIQRRHQDGALMVREVGGGYQLVTKPEYAPWIEKLGRPVVHAPLSQASTETLAIIAYRQPVTKAEIEEIRGVRCDSAINNLLERELICELGRKDGPGRPILYGVTEKFLVHFGLKGLEELPPLSIT